MANNASISRPFSARIGSNASTGGISSAGGCGSRGKRGSGTDPLQDGASASRRARPPSRIVFIRGSEGLYGVARESEEYFAPSFRYHDGMAVIEARGVSKAY